MTLMYSTQEVAKRLYRQCLADSCSAPVPLSIVSCSLYVASLGDDDTAADSDQ